MRQYIFGILGAIIGFLVLVFILNYFNILPLSKFSPILPSLPQITTDKTTSTKAPAGSKTKYPCPVEVDKCLGEKIASTSADPNFSGIGYLGLNPGTKIKALASGRLGIRIQKVQSGDEVVIFNIRDDEQKVNFGYVFKKGEISGGLEDGSSVSNGQVIGVLGSKVFTKGKVYFNEYSLVLSISEGDTGQYLKLEPLEDGISL